MRIETMEQYGYADQGSDAPVQTPRTSARFSWRSIYFEQHAGQAPAQAPGGHCLIVDLGMTGARKTNEHGAKPLSYQRRGSVSYIPDGMAPRQAPDNAGAIQYRMFVHTDLVEKVASELGVADFFGNPSVAPSEDWFVLETAEAIKRELASGNPHGGLFGEIYARILAAHIVIRYKGEQPQRGKSTVLSAARLRSVDRYIAARLPRSINLAELAQQAGLSQFYFCRLFKEATGLPPYKYVLHKRVELACAHLRADTPSIQEIAFTTGFSDPVQFAKRFKQVSGMTPSEYRAQHRGALAPA